MNKVILLGRLVRDVEIKKTQSNEPMSIADFTVAVDRPHKKDGESKADFINCVAFGATGENIGKYFFKGNKIAVTGRLQVDSYKDKEGKNRVSTKVVVESFDFCESRTNNSESNTQTPQSYPQSTSIDNSNNGFYFTSSENADENDLPF